MSVSSLDSTRNLSQTEWATTLICTPGISFCDLNSNHAMLVIEGFDAVDKYFRKIIHLRGLPSDYGNKLVKGCSYYFGFGKIGKVEIKNLGTKHVNYTHKSETWIRSAEKVQKMIAEAEKEQNNQLANPRAFNIFGKKSIFAKEMLTFKISHPFLQEIYKLDPHSLMRLYTHAKKYKDYLFNAAFDPFSGYLSSLRIKQQKELEEFRLEIEKDEKRYLSSVQEPIESNVPKRPVLECGKRLMHEFQTMGKAGKWEYLRTRNMVTAIQEQAVSIVASSSIKSFIKKYTQISQKIRANLQEDERTSEIKEKLTYFESVANKDGQVAYRELLVTVYNGLEQVTLQPDSCFTWAREKLHVIDVSIEDKSIERIVTLTKLYLNKK